MLNVLQGVVGTGDAIDVQDLFARFTLDTAGEFLFGTPDLNTLDLPLPRAKHAKLGAKGTAPEGAYGGFAQAFEEGQVNTSTRLGKAQVVWTAEEFFKDSQAGVSETMSAFLDPLVKKALANKASGENVDGDQDSFLDHLARSTGGQFPEPTSQRREGS